MSPGKKEKQAIHTANALRGYQIENEARKRGADAIFGGIHATLYWAEPIRLRWTMATQRGHALADCENGQKLDEYDGELLDAALIGAAQRVEHYEMAGYGTVIAFSEELGESQHVELLNETLEEEKETDEKLTGLAGDINAQANLNEESAEAETTEKSEPGRRDAAKSNTKSRSAAQRAD